MFIHPNLQDARPLMVVGAPRCGTRFVAHALNRHPSILVQGEIRCEVMQSAIRFLSETGDFFNSKPQWSTPWNHGRRDFLYAIWGSVTKKSYEARAIINWFGHKTPRHDRYWKFYQKFIGEIPVKYVFCMRNFVDHYLSMISMKEYRGSPHDIKNIAREYRASVARYAEMKTALGADVSLFVLDDLREGDVDYVRETLFERLGIDVDEATLTRIDVSQRSNPTEARGARRKELTADERVFLDENPDLLEGLVALRAARPLAPATDSAD